MLIAAIVSVDPFGERLRPGTGAGFVVLAAFVLSFLAIRTSARLTRSVSWWPGGVETGGVHIHHLVWGICLMMFCGFLAFAAPLEAPWWHFVAIGFGVGAGLTMDEFALWVRLQDVYWATEGRASFDAVVIAAAFAGLVVLGTQPFGLDDPASISGTAVAVALILGLAVICFVKGRVLLGVHRPLRSGRRADRGGAAGESIIALGAAALLGAAPRAGDRTLQPHPARGALAAPHRRPHRGRAQCETGARGRHPSRQRRRPGPTTRT